MSNYSISDHCTCREKLKYFPRGNIAHPHPPAGLMLISELTSDVHGVNYMTDTRYLNWPTTWPPFLKLVQDNVIKCPRFRFDRENIFRIVQLVTPHLGRPVNNRGRPLSPEQIVCCGLEVLAGGHFFRIAGYCQGISTATAWKCLYR